jgi:hypothetical protein
MCCSVTECVGTMQREIRPRRCLLSLVFDSSIASERFHRECQCNGEKCGRDVDHFRTVWQNSALTILGNWSSNAVDDSHPTVAAQSRRNHVAQCGPYTSICRYRLAFPLQTRHGTANKFLHYVSNSFLQTLPHHQKKFPVALHRSWHRHPHHRYFPILHVRPSSSDSICNPRKCVDDPSHLADYRKPMMVKWEHVYLDSPAW